MKISLLFLPFFLFCSCILHAQEEPFRCAQDDVMRQLLNQNLSLQKKQDSLETMLYRYHKGQRQNNAAEETYILPVVIHIIHNNGPENISDATVQTGLQHLNEAFANAGYYNPATGADTKIQFCLVQQDPSGNHTSGINRVVSPYTVTNGANNLSDDIALKNTIRWNPKNYINIWLVNSIIGPAVGYAYLPVAHGSNVDGIVAEAGYFGSSFSDDVVIIHEMGHYLGLYHTFQNGCSNYDCASDGDKVCDTPPDNSTSYTGCNTPVNSCSTDGLSGFSTDQNDLREDYMDYGNLNCMNVFTDGQKDRMRWHLVNVRGSLLQSHACLSSCLSPVTAIFSSSATNISAGTNVNFTNASVNGTAYKWLINDILQATSFHYNYTFNQPGQYVVRLIVSSNNPAQCDSSEITETINVNCPAHAAFTPVFNGVVTTGQTVNFTNTSTAATAYEWQVSGITQSLTPDLSYTFNSTGTYFIKLIAGNGVCKDSAQVFYVVNVPALAGFSTFHKHFNVVTNYSAGMFVYDAVQDANGNSVLCGMHNDTAIVAAYTPDGKVLWSKRLQNGETSILTTIKRTADNGFIVGGMKDYYCLNCYTPWLIKLDASGNVQWSKAISGPSAGDYLTDLIQLSNGGYAFVFTANTAAVSGAYSDIGIGQMDAAGNPVWLTYYHKAQDVAGGLTETADGIIVCGSYKTNNPKYNGLLIKLDKSTGAFIWAKTYDLENKDNRFQKVFKFGNKLLVSGYNMINGNVVSDEKTLLQLDLDGNSLLGQKIKIPNTKADGKAIGFHGNGSYTVAINGAGTGSTYAINFFDNGTINLKKKYNNNGSVFVNAVLPYPNGIYLAGYRPYDYMQLYKTDASFSTPGCQDEDFTPPVSTFTPTVIPVSNNFFAIYGGGLFTYNVPLSVTDLPMEEHFSCNDFPALTNCDSATFQKSFTGVGAEKIYDMAIKTNGNVVVSGTKTIFTGATAFISEISPSGTLLNSLSYTGEKGFTHLISTADNGYLAAGSDMIWDEVYSSGFLSLTKLNGNFQVEWSKKFGFHGLVRKLFQTLEGNYIFLVLDAYTSYISCIDPTGAIIWTRSYAAFSLQFWDLIEDGNFLVATVYPDGLLVKLNKSNGDILWTREYRSLPSNLYVPAALKIFKSGNSYYLSGGLTASSETGSLLKTDTAGTARQYLSITVPGATFYEHLKVLNGGDTTFTLCLRAKDYTTFSNDNFYLLKLDTSLQVLSSFKTGAPHKEAAFTIRPMNGRTAYVGGYYSEAGSNTDLLFYKMNLESINNNCNVLAVSALTTTGAAHNINPSTVPKAYNWTTTTQTLPLTVSPYPLQSISKCFASACMAPASCDSVNCNHLSLTGADRTCNYGDTVIIRANRSLACSIPVQWSVAPSTNVIITYSSDSLIRLRFLQSGSYTINAKLLSTCAVAEASHTVQIGTSSGQVNLGPDTSLCTSSIYVLHAGSGFISYQWQDGTTDSTYTVYVPGTYTVEAKDACGNRFRDTVTITRAQPVSFDLGSDKTMCNNVAVTLTAPQGFSNYIWAPNYNISSINVGTVQVFPVVDTIYVVTAVKNGSCSVIDSIRIKVASSPSIHLGNDTSFCKGGAVPLDAGGGFARYLWNTGQTTQQVTVGLRGTYFVEATTSDGCSSRDTLTLVNVFEPLPIGLGRDTGLCEGQTLTLNAGTGFSSYLWSSGTTTSTISVHTPGLYWVKATDSHDCQSTDSLSITAIYPKPLGFLTKDTSLCLRETLSLKPNERFADYLWSSGSTLPEIIIAGSGSYWLQVTTSAGCVAREYIMVTEKVCKQVLYFPSAFTPNNDGRNDLFRAKVYGKILQYKLSVFNRWGQEVFKTNEALKGWDGKVAGKDQTTGVFVWYCTYQFDGEKIKTQKGTIALIR